MTKSDVRDAVDWTIESPIFWVGIVVQALLTFVFTSTPRDFAWLFLAACVEHLVVWVALYLLFFKDLY